MSAGLGPRVAGSWCEPVKEVLSAAGANVSVTARVGATGTQGVATEWRAADGTASGSAVVHNANKCVATDTSGGAEINVG